jgi:hypothetical protein
MPTSLSTYIAVNYLTDSTYADGTVLTPGGTRELTACKSNSDHIVGVKCDSTSAGSAAWDSGTIVLGAAGTNKQTVATVGRVNVKVLGPVTKGDWLGPAGFKSPTYNYEQVYTLVTPLTEASQDFKSISNELAQLETTIFNYRFNTGARLGKTTDLESAKLYTLLFEKYKRQWQLAPEDWKPYVYFKYSEATKDFQKLIDIGSKNMIFFQKGERVNYNKGIFNSGTIISATGIYKSTTVQAGVGVYGINTSGCAKTVESKNQAFAIALESAAQYTDSTAYLSPSSILCSLL